MSVVQSCHVLFEGNLSISLGNCKKCTVHSNQFNAYDIHLHIAEVVCLNIEFHSTVEGRFLTTYSLHIRGFLIFIFTVVSYYAYLNCVNIKLFFYQ
jgi:hypothetical protein